MKLIVLTKSLTILAICSISAIFNCDRINAATSGKQSSQIGRSDLAQNLQQQTDLLLVAGIQKFKVKDYAGAISEFSKAIQLNPSSEKAWYNRAVSYGASGNRQGAIDDYSQVIKLNPQHTTSYYNRAVFKE